MSFARAEHTAYMLANYPQHCNRTSRSYPRAGPTLIGVLRRLEGMVAGDINGLVLKRIQSVQDIFKVALDVLKDTRSGLEETAEETSPLEVLQLLCREGQ